MTQAVRVDLDGNGSDEVLLTVTRWPRARHARPARRLLGAVRAPGGGGQRRGRQLRPVDPRPHHRRAPVCGRGDRRAVADLNGDGRMEVITEHELFEGRSAYAYELDSGRQR